MLVRKQTMSSVPFPSNTGETGSQKKGFGTQPGDAFTMPWFWQAWPFHLLQPWAIQCGWNRKQLGTHCDCSIWHKHALGRNAPICCIQWGNANRVTLDSRLISLFSVSGPSLIGSWGRRQAQPWAEMLAPSWHCMVTPVPQHQSQLPSGPAGASEPDRGASAPRAQPWHPHLTAVPGTVRKHICTSTFMAPDVVCGFPSPLNYLSFASHQLGPQKGVPASCREGLSHSAHSYHTALGACLMAGNWHCAMSAGRASLAQPAVLSRFSCHCVCVSGPVREHCVFSCVCAPWLWELSTENQEPSIGLYVSGNS